MDKVFWIIAGVVGAIGLLWIISIVVGYRSMLKSAPDWYDPQWYEDGGL